MKKLLLTLLALTSISIQAEDTANISSNLVIHNYRSVPLKVTGRQAQGQLCLWNQGTQKWSCRETDTIPTGGIAIVHDKDNSASWGYPTIVKTIDNKVQSNLHNASGYIIFTDLGKLSINESL